MKISLIRKDALLKKNAVKSFSVLPTVGAIPTAIWLRQRILILHPAIILTIGIGAKGYQHTADHQNVGSNTVKI